MICFTVFQAIHNFLIFLSQAPAAIIESVGKLKEICGDENVSSSMSVREHHSHDESYHTEGTPSIVVFPTTVEQVSEVAKLCYEKDIRMIPFGTGTGLEGGVNAMEASIYLLFGIYF